MTIRDEVASLRDAFLVQSYGAEELCRSDECRTLQRLRRAIFLDAPIGKAAMWATVLLNRAILRVLRRGEPS